MSSLEPSQPARGEFGAAPTKNHVINKLKRALERDDDMGSVRALKIKAVDAVLTAIDDPDVEVADLQNMLRHYQLPYMDAFPDKPSYDWTIDFDERFKLNQAIFQRFSNNADENPFGRGRILSAAVMLAPMQRLREISCMPTCYGVHAHLLSGCYSVRDNLVILCNLSLARDKPRRLNSGLHGDDDDDGVTYHEWYGISQEEVSAERSAIQEALTRDKCCVITKAPRTKSCYLYNPFLRSYLSEFREALETVSLVWGREKIDKYLEKLTKESLSGPSNIISLSPLAREYWKRGWIALEPIRQETSTSIRVRFHVLRTTGDVSWAICEDIRQLLEPIYDEFEVDIALFEHGTHEHIPDGFEFLITADDARNLPDLELMRLHWEIRQIASLAGFGLGENGFYD